MRGRLGHHEQGLLELVESELQPWMPFGAMDFPMGVGPFANPRVMPLFNADSLVSGMGIINLLIVDSGIFDHCLHQGMAKTGTIGSACFRHKGCITVSGGTTYLRDLCQQDFASNL